MFLTIIHNYTHLITITHIKRCSLGKTRSLCYKMMSIKTVTLEKVMVQKKLKK